MLTLLDCQRRPTKPVQRLSIVPANILVPDSSSEWMRFAVPLVLEQDLASTPDLAVTVASGESGVYQAAAGSVLRTTLTAQPRGLAIHSALSDVPTQRITRDFAAHGAPSALIPLLDTLARQLDAHAVPFSTRSEAALEAFTAGFFASEPQRKIERLRQAIAIDPSFGLAHLALADTLAVVRSPDLPGALANASAHRASFTPLDQARLAFLQSRLSGAPLASRVSAARALLKLTPNDANALVSLSSYLFLSRGAEEAEQLLARALLISPDNIQFRQELAVGLFESRKFAPAAQIFESLASLNPAFVSQLAFCQLLAGDPARAGGTFEKFIASVSNPDAKSLLRASWQALAGNRDQAVRQLSGAQFANANVTELARTEMVIWQLLSKQPEAARRTALNGNVLAGLLARGASSADEWRAQVEHLPSAVAAPELKLALLRNGYFLLGFYPESVAAWQAADRETGGTDLRVRAMLAASLRAAGRPGEAEQVNVQPFLPDFNDLFSSVSFAALRRLLGQAG